MYHILKFHPSTVVSRYLELGYLEHNTVSVGFDRYFSVVYYHVTQTRISRIPRLFLSPRYKLTLFSDFVVLTNLNTVFKYVHTNQHGINVFENSVLRCVSRTSIENDSLKEEDGETTL